MTAAREQILLMPMISVITDFIILCLLGQFIPYSLLLQELDIKNLRELEVNVHTTAPIHVYNYPTVSYSNIQYQANLINPLSHAGRNKHTCR